MLVSSHLFIPCYPAIIFRAALLWPIVGFNKFWFFTLIQNILHFLTSHFTSKLMLHSDRPFSQWNTGMSHHGLVGGWRLLSSRRVVLSPALWWHHRHRRCALFQRVFLFFFFFFGSSPLSVVPPPPRLLRHVVRWLRQPQRWAHHL